MRLWGRRPDHRAIRPKLLVEQYFRDARKELLGRNPTTYWVFDCSDVVSSKALLDGSERPEELLISIATLASTRPPDPGDRYFPFSTDYRILDPIVSKLLQRHPKFTEVQLAMLVNLQDRRKLVAHLLPVTKLSRFTIALVKSEGLTAGLERIAKSLLRAYEDHRRFWDAEDRRTARNLTAILDGRDPNERYLFDAWQKSFSDRQWSTAVDAAFCVRSVRPSAKWISESTELLRELAAEEFLDCFESSIQALKHTDRPVDPDASDMLRGLCWLVSLIGTDRAKTLLGDMLLVCAHKIPNFGARSKKGVSACAESLASIGDIHALGSLCVAKAKIKSPPIVEQINSLLDRAAQTNGVSLDELEEIVVPALQLSPQGEVSQRFGDVIAILRICGTTNVEISWFRGERQLANAPSEIKKEFANELKLLAARRKEISSALAAQKQRLEALFLKDRSWSYSTWRERFIDHPLLSEMSRRLIWRFSSESADRLGIATDGVVRNESGSELTEKIKGSAVSLWHPLDCGLSSVETWREFLIQNRISQPFKQAHREVYILTDAERETVTHSNRFAAHVIKQHQAAALMRARGWRYQLQGYFDSQSVPTLALRELELSAQYWLDIPEFGTDVADTYMSESGVAIYALTDQVCFVSQGGDRVPLDQIPQRVFSEVMRDVDLFVGVASVGADQNWSDHGDRMGYQDYWQRIAFGDLSASAETRREVLSRLLPRLPFSSSTEIDGKFLIVRGKLRTYKIHLGSGNILMSPNDQYLCIVPNSADKDGLGKIYLPFEGDTRMAIILSKAMLLLDDDKIKDPVILQQFKRAR